VTKGETRKVATRQRVRRIVLVSFLLLFPLTFNYYSPALPIEGTFERVIVGSFLFWGAWTVASLALGRAACGYVCRYCCWFAPLNIIGTTVKNATGLPSLRLEGDRNACAQCRSCERACPMSLPVSEMVATGTMDHTECILCGTCVDSCPKGAIRYAWGRQARGGIDNNCMEEALRDGTIR